MISTRPGAPRSTLYLLSQALQMAQRQCQRATPGAEQSLLRLLSTLEREAAVADRSDVTLLATQLRTATRARREVLLRSLGAAVLRTPALAESPTVLLVDDDSDMELLVRVALEPWCTVAVARTLGEAREAVAQSDLSCLILDLSLPDGDGCQVLEGLGRERGGAPLPCIVLTASTEHYRISEALALGADGFLTKPVAVGQLAANVGRAIQRHQEHSRSVSRDSLTTILNRRGLEEAAERAIAFAVRSGAPLCLAVLDLDGFKAVNDRLGHLAGDRVLRRFAQVLKHNLRREDVPGRWGGDEFVVLFPNTSEAGARQALEKVRVLVVEAPLDVSGGVHVSFSAGIATLQGTTRSIQDLVRVADERMYGDKASRRAKRAGLVGRAPTGWHEAQ